jgi:hypothetical protein
MINMNFLKLKCKNFLLDHRFIPFILTVFYFLFSLKYYIKEYEIPDFFMYSGFWASNGPFPKDGFSSLFCLVSAFAVKHTHFFEFISLLLLASSILVLLFLYRGRSVFDRVLYAISILSFGIWWYFYGKVYYDFPFIAFNYSLLLLFSQNYLKPFVHFRRLSRKDCKFFFLIFFLSGICLSWKPYAIFPIAGLLGLIFIHNNYYEYIFKQIAKTREIIFFTSFVFIFFLMGYLIGNFSFFISPKLTIEGIRGYYASSDLTQHLFNNDKKIWDHINLQSFNTGNCNFFVFFSIFLFVPFLSHNKKLLLSLNFFLLACYGIFISFFSAGFLWHSFPISLYAITLILYAFNHLDLKLKNTLILFFLILIQSITNFYYYLPKEVSWFKNTDIVYNSFVLNKKLITKDIFTIAKTIHNESYCIDIKLKRFSSYSFLNPIELNNDLWNEALKKSSKCEDANYEIFLGHDALLKIQSFDSNYLKDAIYLKRYDQIHVGLRKISTFKSP